MKGRSWNFCSAFVRKWLDKSVKTYSTCSGSDVASSVRTADVRPPVPAPTSRKRSLRPSGKFATTASIVSRTMRKYGRTLTLSP